MKIVLLTSDYHLSANIAVKTFLNSPFLKKHDIQVVGMISSSPYKVGNGTWKKMRSFMKRTGWSFSIKTIITILWKKIEIKFGKWFVPNKSREYFEIDELAHQHDIPFLEVKDINSPRAKEFMRKFKPDYLVSCFLLQIVDKEVLKIPAKGAINAHPALIQKHRGTFTSFWAILKNWKKSGATVHFMTEKPDKGLVILQRYFFVHPSDTIYCINKKSAQLGASLLVKALIKLKRNEAIGYIMKQFGQMFRMPKMEDVKNFYRRGKSLIKVRDFFEI